MAKPPTSTLRAILKAELGDDIGVKMARSIEAALESTKTEWFECDHCHRKSAFVFPNMYERVKAAQLVIEQLEGKVGTHREAPAAVKVTGDLADLSDDDLLALLNTEGEPDEDGD